MMRARSQLVFSVVADGSSANAGAFRKNPLINTEIADLDDWSRRRHAGREFVC